MVRGTLILFLISVCVLSMPDFVNLQQHSDDFVQMGWNHIRRDIFRESPAAPQKYVGLPPPFERTVSGDAIDRKF
tara:strand:+ start:1212 stop:1436 length:225 start_codon:yes stop_codon:yes gene_type:complete